MVAFGLVMSTSGHGDLMDRRAMDLNPPWLFSPLLLHIGPYGKDRCVWGVLDGFKQRIDELETTVAANKGCYVKDLAVLEERQVELENREKDSQHRLKSLQEIIKSLQSCSEDHSLGDGSTPKIDIDLDDTAGLVTVNTDNTPPEQTCSSKADSVLAEVDSPVFTFAEIVSVANEPARKDSFSGEEGLRNPEISEKDDGFVKVQPRRRSRTVQSVRHDDSVPGVNSRQSNPNLNMRASAGVDQSKPALGKLLGAQRVKKQVFYLGGVNPDCSAEDITTFCAQHCSILQCQMMTSRRTGTQAARIIVSSNDVDVLESIKWPTHVYLRRWNFKSSGHVSNDRPDEPSDGSATASH